MEDKSLSDLLSQVLPGDEEESAAKSEQSKVGEDNLLVMGLKTLAGNAEGDLEKAINQFLKGKGALHDLTSAAVTRSKTTADSEIAELLEKTFKLSPAIAKLIAPLLTKLLPFTKKEKESASPKEPRKTKPKATAKEKEEVTSKKKPGKKTTKKTKTSASAKKEETSSTAKKPKKKTTAKPKTTTSKAKPKKKASASTKPKK